jgi:hypothetical protein
MWSMDGLGQQGLELRMRLAENPYDDMNSMAS